eukprot:8105112-Alexandrium_andersonii.AAC.1
MVANNTDDQAKLHPGLQGLARKGLQWLARVCKGLLGLASTAPYDPGLRFRIAAGSKLRSADCGLRPDLGCGLRVAVCGLLRGRLRIARSRMPCGMSVAE